MVHRNKYPTTEFYRLLVLSFKVFMRKVWNNTLFKKALEKENFVRDYIGSVL
jgi:hypothetical protein